MLADIRLWTVKDDHRMVEAGILQPEERVELIEVFRNPTQDSYQIHTKLGETESLVLLSFPTITVSLAEMFGRVS